LKSIEINLNQLKSIEIHLNPGKSIEIHLNPGKSNLILVKNKLHKTISSKTHLRVLYICPIT